MRRGNFYFSAGDARPTRRHLARSLNFQDQSIFSYPQPGKHWWGYS